MIRTCLLLPSLYTCMCMQARVHMCTTHTQSSTYPSLSTSSPVTGLVFQCQWSARKAIAEELHLICGVSVLRPICLQQHRSLSNHRSITAVVLSPQLYACKVMTIFDSAYPSIWYNKTVNFNPISYHLGFTM
jgi:hypothetical protein